MLSFRRQLGGHCAHIGQDVVVHYRWHPLYGQRARCILTERRASGEIAQIEVAPGIFTKVAVWKLDRVHCAGLGIGAPRVSLAALIDLRELLGACESPLISSDRQRPKETHNAVPHAAINIAPEFAGHSGGAATQSRTRSSAPGRSAAERAPGRDRLACSPGSRGPRDAPRRNEGE
jgi:hypothetical protein